MSDHAACPLCKAWSSRLESISNRIYNFPIMKNLVPESRRVKREKKTLLAMIRIYCHNTHRTRKNLCPECAELLDYALVRLDKCPFGASKPACNKCQIHCYKPTMRERTKAVMRHAGPRMILPHPLLSVFHLIDERKKSPVDFKRENFIL